MQYYCDKTPCISGPDALALFDITYSRIKGTTTDKPMGGGIFLNCSDGVPCSGLQFNDVSILSSSNRVLQPLLRNAFGTVSGAVAPSLSTLPSLPPSGSLLAAIQKQAAICG